MRYEKLIQASKLDSHQLSKTTINTYLSKASINGDIQRVRRGFYVSKEVYSKFAAACNAVPDGFLAYHGALEFLGLQTQVFQELIVSSPVRFRIFSFDNTDIKWTQEVSRKQIESKTIDGLTVKYTGLERTLVDCLLKPALSGGYEEIMNAFSMLHPGMIDFKKVTQMLFEYNIKSLWSRVGFMFQHYGVETAVPDWFLQKCHEHSGNIQSCMSRYLKSSYVKEWGLLVPDEILFDISNGLYYEPSPI